jgi:hypothetical protein
MNAIHSLLPLSLCAALPALLLGCASTSVGTGDMSARDHEAAAAAEKAEAREHANRYDPRAVRYVDLYPEPLVGCDQSGAGTCSPHWSMTKNPTEYELSQAAAHLAQAKKHREAARALRDAEAKACSQIAFRDRDLSPLLHQRDVASVEEIGHSGGRGPLGAPAGAAIVFAAVSGLTAEVLQHIADCHLARNAALGFDQIDYNDPLNVHGASAKVRTIGGRVVLEVTSTDAGAALEILRRARALLTQGQLVSSGP